MVRRRPPLEPPADRRRTRHRRPPVRPGPHHPEPARDALVEAYGPTCFYRQTTVGSSAAADHVLPWSRIGLDGLTNLVLACHRCNTDTSDTLPQGDLVEQAVGRDQQKLKQLAETINWPTQRQRTVDAARGLYRTYPTGSPVWTAYQQTTPSGPVPENWLLAS